MVLLVGIKCLIHLVAPTCLLAHQDFQCLRLDRITLVHIKIKQKKRQLMIFAWEPVIPGWGSGGGAAPGGLAARLYCGRCVKRPRQGSQEELSSSRVVVSGSGGSSSGSASSLW